MERTKSIAEQVFIGISLLTVLGFIISEHSYERPSVIVYDCTIAEYATDVPVQIKEECRKIRGLRI
jgi:hypothetical protein